MRYLISSCILLILKLNIFAQSFAPVGTIWNYNYGTTCCPGGPGGVLESGQAMVKVVADTTIKGQSVKKLIQYDHYIQYGGSAYQDRSFLLGFLFLRNDSIFFCSNDTLQNPVYLYGFNMNVNDTLKSYYSQETISVDSIKIEMVNGQPKKVFYVNNYGNVGKIIDGVGLVDDYLLWNDYVLEYGTIYSFTCFTDGINSYPDGTTCTPVLAIEKEVPVSFKVYPNPCKDNIQISSSTKIIRAEIFSTTGLTVISVPAQSQDIVVNLGYLPQGIYLLKVTDELGNHSTKQIILDK